MDLHIKYRPKTLAGIVGNEETAKILASMVAKKQVPHSVLLSGPSGCGKTTTARILINVLDCSKSDFKELNAADFRGIDMVRDIRTRMSLAPMNGKVRCYLIDEAHQLTKDAQNALLKITEDTPKHVYFFFATTEPGKLLKTLANRCTELRMSALSPKTMQALLEKVAAKEKIDLTEDVTDRIIEVAEGSPRRALVVLGQIANLEDEEERLNAILSSDTKRATFDLFKAMAYGKPNWADIKKILKGMDEEPESIRHYVLACATNMMLSDSGKGLGQAAKIINAFRDNFFDSKKAGLVLACYEATLRD